MPTVESLRHLINERLTAAAEEILGVFEHTLSAYEDEIHRQRRLLDIVLRPEIKLHRTELPQQHVCTEEEVLAYQQLCIQERNSSLDQEDPEPPQIKEEQEEVCTSQEGEQLVLKQETDTFMLTPTYERSDHSKDWTQLLDPDGNLNAAEKESVVNIPVKSSVVSEPSSDQQLLSHNSPRAAEKEPPDNISPKRTIPESDRESSGGPEPNSDHQLLFHTSRVADNQDHKSGNHGHATKPKKKHKGTSTSTRNTKPKCDQEHKTYSSEKTVSTTYSQPKPSDKSFKCNSCSKDFDLYTRLKVHMMTHTAEKPFSCTVCGKGFSFKRYLKQHMITHSGDKPYACNTCPKSFRRFEHVQIHMRSHTGERPYSCVDCERAFSTSSALKKHVRLHTGEEPYNCSIWGELLL